MPDPSPIVRRQRAERLRADRALAKELTVAYRGAWERVKSELDRIGADIKAAKERGEKVGRVWLIKQARLDNLERQVRAELSFVLDMAERKISAAQADALVAGRADAAELMLATLGPTPAGAVPPALSIAATERMVSRAAAGKPLGQLLATLGDDLAQEVRRRLAVGVALGRNPREVARDVRTAFGGNLARALTVSRTEMLGAYRAAALDMYRANPGLVTGWIWSAQLGHRTCAMCWAMNGEWHTLDQTLDSHANCRCAMVPQTKTWAELGFPGVRESRLELESGEDVFARMEPALQRAVLGPGKYDAYRSGDLRLRDLVQETRSPVWGRGRREKSLRDAVGVPA